MTDKLPQLTSFLCGEWREGTGDPIEIFNPTTETAVATVGRATDLDKATAWGREIGGKNLRAMSYAQRGEMLQQMARALHEHREALIAIAIENGGNTRGDAKFDIDGATAVLASYAELAEGLGERPWIVEDAEAAPLHRGAKVRAQHVLLPRRGLAVHINAFNFPAWGMLGKAAVALLAGMPVLSKPGTSTSALAHRMAQILVDAKCVPEGAFQLLMGPAQDLLDHLEGQDVVAFTGSADTGARIRGHQNIVAQSVRVNVEADSLNSVIIGPDVESGTELFDLAVRDLVTEMTQKAGQKCTATRRILVPETRLEQIRERLVEGLQDIASKTGDPGEKTNRMGPLSTASQLDDARRGLSQLQEHAEVVLGQPERADWGKGWFLEPILLQATAEAARSSTSNFHHTEVFGPVATLLPYDGTVETASEIVGFGGGSLVTTVYSDDRDFLGRALAEVGPYLGRIVVASEKIARASYAPGCVFPVVNHGGPGRAGSGGELGGRHGLVLYMQRVAVQGGASELARLLG